MVFSATHAAKVEKKDQGTINEIKASGTNTKVNHGMATAFTGADINGTEPNILATKTNDAKPAAHCDCNSCCHLGN